MRWRPYPPMHSTLAAAAADEVPSTRIKPMPLSTLLALLLLMSGHTLRAQGQPQPKISVEVKVVNILATVRDKHGKIVPDLNKEDFNLEEDGHPQAITYFSRETDLPLTLGLLVDTSLSQRRVLGQERDASYSFLDQMMRAKDQAFVIHFDREVELLQDLTSSHQKLQKALGEIDEPSFSNGGGSGGSSGGGRGSYGGGGTLLYDAVYLASNEEMKKQQGRKALIILSDGVDHGSKESLLTSIEAAQRADTVVYSILFSDEQSPSPNPFGGFGGMGRRGGMGGPRGGGYPREERPDGKKILERMSKETGGRLFEVTKKQPIDDIYSQIEDELRNQYSLGYTPGADSGEGYHKILLTTKKKELTVQTREGYYADK